MILTSLLSAGKIIISDSSAQLGILSPVPQSYSHWIASESKFMYVPLFVDPYYLGND